VRRTDGKTPATNTAGKYGLWYRCIYSRLVSDYSARQELTQAKEVPKANDTPRIFPVK